MLYITVLEKPLLQYTLYISGLNHNVQEIEICTCFGEVVLIYCHDREMDKHDGEVVKGDDYPVHQCYTRDMKLWKSR